ncbi:MAG: RNA degradosome polyphosphate kinase, partial [Pseudomonas sp.]|nr:RNA degradosome polyphosphate kinase [Pseudomonas sp.]
MQEVTSVRDELAEISETAESVIEEAPAPPVLSDPPVHAADINVPELYIHRELSQLQFNIRVLEQALDESYPLLERLKFLLIFSSNIDEFFEIRVAGLKKQITFAREQTGPDGLQPQQVLSKISEIAHQQITRQYALLNDMLLPQLAE